MKIALLAHLHHPIAEPFRGGTEMHTALVADELTRRGHEVTLFAKAGSRTAAQLVPLVGEDFEFGRMPGPDGDRSEEILVSAVSSAIATIRAGRYDVVLNNSLGPQPYTSLAGQPMITILHTPPTLEKVLAVIEQTRLGAGPVARVRERVRVQFGAPGGACCRTSPACRTASGSIAGSMRAGQKQISRSGRRGSLPRRACTWRSTPSVAPTCAWNSAARSPTRPTSTPRSLPGSGQGCATSGISAMRSWPVSSPAVRCSCRRRSGPNRSGSRSSKRCPAAPRWPPSRTGRRPRSSRPAPAVWPRPRRQRRSLPRSRPPDGSTAGRVRSRAEDFDAMIMVDRYEELLQDVARRRVPVPVMS